MTIYNRRIWILIIITSILFNSCSSVKESKSIDDRIIGEWNTESFLPQFVHAVISIQLKDPIEIPNHRINTAFSLSFKKNNLFYYDNKNEVTKKGVYKITDSILTLKLENDSLCLLTFNIDSLTNKRLYLKSESIKFYTYTTDNLHYFTGNKVVLILKRK